MFIDKFKQQETSSQKKVKQIQIKYQIPVAKKTLIIEQKLSMFRQQKQKQKQKCKLEMTQIRQKKQAWVQKNRKQTLQKLRKAHNFFKEQDKKIYQFWEKTQNIKIQRLQKQKTFKKINQEDQKKKNQNLKVERTKLLTEDLNYFQNNCLRLAIQLKHQPGQSLKPSVPFNQVIYLQQIKARAQIMDFQAKQRKIRRNRMQIQQQNAQKISDSNKMQNDIIEHLYEISKKHSTLCSDFFINFSKKQQEKKARKLKSQNFQKKIIQQFQTSIQLISKRQQENRQKAQQQWRNKKLFYFQQNLNQKVKRKQKHKKKLGNILQSFIQLTQVLYSYQLARNQIQIPIYHWREMMNRFINQIKFQEQKGVSSFLKVGKTNAVQNTEQIQQKYYNSYFNNLDQWKCNNDNSRFTNKSFSALISNITNFTYPPLQLSLKNILPNYLAFKLVILGDTCSGKTTLSNLISQKYGAIVIDCSQIIRQKHSQAWILQQQELKAKKSTKKQAKKQEQKIKQPQQIQLFPLLQKNLSKHLVNTQLKTILLQSFNSFNNLASVNTSLEQNKKKKDLKNTKKQDKKDEDPLQALINQKKYPHTKGLILINQDSNLQQLQKFLTGDKKISQKQNLQAKKILLSLENYLQPNFPIIERPKSFADLYIYLNVSAENKQRRLKGRKMDQGSGIFYYEGGYPSQKGVQQRLIENSTQVKFEKEQLKVIEGEFEGCHIKQISQSQLYKQFCQIDSQISQILSTKNKVYKSILQGTYIQNNLIVDKPDNLFTPNQKFKQLLQLLVKQKNNYVSSIELTIKALFKRKEYFFNIIRNIQQKFLQIIERPSDKNHKINSFIDSYNRLIEQNKGILGHSQAKNHLKQKIQNLHQSLWKNIEQLQKEAIQSKKQIQSSSFLDNQYQNFIQSFVQFTHIQLKKLCQLVTFLFNLNLANADQALQFHQQNLLMLYQYKKGVQFSQNLDRIQQLALKVCYQAGNQMFKTKMSKLNKKKEVTQTKSRLLDMSLTIFQEQQNLFKRRLASLKSYFTYLLNQKKAIFMALLNRLDDWIIFGIKNDSDGVYKAIKQIKNNINQNRVCSINSNTSQNISSIFLIINPSNLNFHIPLKEESQNLSLFCLKIFYQEIKTLSKNRQIPLQILKSYLVNRSNCKSMKTIIPENMRGLRQFQLIQQYLCDNGIVHFNQLILIFLLSNSKVPQLDQIQQIQQKLSNFGKQIQEVDFCNQSFFFQASQSIPNSQFYRQIQIKRSIFQVFRDTFTGKMEWKSFTDTLRVFNSLQIERFWEVIVGKKI